MIRRITIYLLLALIALQSVAAMPDTYKLYQSGTELLPAAHKYLDADTNFDGRLGKQMPDKQLPMTAISVVVVTRTAAFGTQ